MLKLRNIFFIILLFFIILTMDKLGGFHFKSFSNEYVVDKSKAKSFSSKDEAINQAKLDSGSEVIFEKDNKWESAPIKLKGLLGEREVSKKDTVDLNKLGLKNPSISFVEDKTPLNTANISKNDIQKIFEKGNYDDLKKLADNPNTPPDILNKLSIKSEFIKVKVAANPSTPKETLKELSNDQSKFVRGNVAENPNTPKEVLRKLANDPTPFVRDRVKN